MNATISDAIKNLISTALQIVLITSNKGSLKGTVTDGDIRRAMLKGYTLKSKVAKKNQPISSHIFRKPSR